VFCAVALARFGEASEHRAAAESAAGDRAGMQVSRPAALGPGDIPER
jgi:hypothetical protein